MNPAGILLAISVVAVAAMAGAGAASNRKRIGRFDYFVTTKDGVTTVDVELAGEKVAHFEVRAGSLTVASAPASMGAEIMKGLTEVITFNPTRDATVEGRTYSVEKLPDGNFLVMRREGGVVVASSYFDPDFRPYRYSETTPGLLKLMMADVYKFPADLFRAQVSGQVGAWWGSSPAWYAALITDGRTGMRSWAGPRKLTSDQAVDWRLDYQERFWDAKVAMYRHDGSRWVAA